MVVRGQPPAPPCDLPLTEQDVREYVRIRGITILRQRIASCGVTFVTDADVERRLRESGADDALIALLNPVPRTPAAGQRWVAPIDKRDMLWVPSGSVRIGSPAEEGGRDKDEAAHTVTLERGFWLDATEVTKQAYRQFLLAVPRWQKAQVDAGLHDGGYLSEWTGNEYPAGESDRPVVNVSWHAAAAFATWAGKRLPTE